ncbi:transmembrane protein 26-like [Saccostrea echinata]|uniref:transmembrane protein 26-like n=1 Tax=Saccostrea echinata TaxID=191078 RepID=UPI002A7F7EF7|nr:transmembrane protein 26-like [Saccostrea echinata]
MDSSEISSGPAEEHKCTILAAEGAHTKKEEIKSVPRSYTEDSKVGTPKSDNQRIGECEKEILTEDEPKNQGINILKEGSFKRDKSKDESSSDMQVSPEISKSHKRQDELDIEMQATTEGSNSMGSVKKSDKWPNPKENVRKRNKSTNSKPNKNRMSTLSLKSLSESIHEKVHVSHDVIQALSVRVLLFIHSCLCVWRTADVKKEDLYWLLAMTNILLGIEALYTCIFRKGRDPKWICPCFVLYLLGTVPAIWFLQLDVLERKFNVNVTSNSSAEELSTFYGVKLIPIALDAETWASILQQLLLFVLVIGRMILPRGHLSRDELSQTLFIFIGSGSDVMEFFVVFEDPVFYTNTGLKYATLIIWSISLLQFIFVIAVAKGPKRFRLGTIVDEKESEHKNFGAELWGLLISITFMDGPYFALRIYAITVHKVLSFGILFFTCKNVLMLILLFYRLFIVVMKIRSKRKDVPQKNLNFS